MGRREPRYRLPRDQRCDVCGGLYANLERHKTQGHGQAWKGNPEFVARIKGGPAEPQAPAESQEPAPTPRPRTWLERLDQLLE